MRISFTLISKAPNMTILKSYFLIFQSSKTAGKFNSDSNIIYRWTLKSNWKQRKQAKKNHTCWLNCPLPSCCRCCTRSMITMEIEEYLNFSSGKFWYSSLKWQEPPFRKTATSTIFSVIWIQMGTKPYLKFSSKLWSKHSPICLNKRGWKWKWRRKYDSELAMINKTFFGTQNSSNGFIFFVSEFEF